MGAQQREARESAEEIAGELLEIYAAREVVAGFAYSPDNTWQTELEASFPYVETPDQLTAIAQIKRTCHSPARWIAGVRRRRLRQKPK